MNRYIPFIFEKFGGIFAVGALALVLSGCAGAVPWNPQGYSGINMIEAEFVVAEGQSGPKSLRVVGGKEQETITFKATLPDGTAVDYTASGVRAFDGQKLRAAVEEAVSDDVKAVAPGIVDNVLKAITRTTQP